MSPEHQAVAAECRRLLNRYTDLQPILENQTAVALPEPGDRLVVTRAPRLDNFLTQPLPGAEPWTGMPGFLVDFENTLRGCQAILEGACDDVPVADLYFRATLEI